MRPGTSIEGAGKRGKGIKYLSDAEAGQIVGAFEVAWQTFENARSMARKLVDDWAHEDFKVLARLCYEAAFALDSVWTEARGIELEVVEGDKRGK